MIVNDRSMERTTDELALWTLSEAYLLGTLTAEREADLRAKSPRVGPLWEHLQGWLGSHASPWLRAAVPFAWEPHTDRGVELTQTERSLNVAARAIISIADMVTIVDGQVVVYGIALGDADITDRLRTSALAAARRHEVDIIYTCTLRLRENGCIEEPREAAGVFELAAHAGVLRERLREVEPVACITPPAGTAPVPYGPKKSRPRKSSAAERTISLLDASHLAECERPPEYLDFDGPPVERVVFEPDGADVHQGHATHLRQRHTQATLCGEPLIGRQSDEHEPFKVCEACRIEASRIRARIEK
jgi:hypothetical protein